MPTQLIVDVKQGEDLQHRFTYHPPQPGQAEAYVLIRQKALELANLLAHLVKPNREHSLAQTKLEEAVMWANASIARNGLRESEAANG